MTKTVLQELFDAIILLKICANQLRLMDFGIIEKCNGAKMTPMAQMNSILGVVYGLVTDKQLNDSKSVLHHCMKYVKQYCI